MPEVIFMVGLPCSGKSTYIKNNELTDYVVVSSDDVIDRIAAEKGITHDEAFSDYIKRATYEMNMNFEAAIKDKKNIIIDRTNMSVHARAKLMARIPTDYIKTALVFDVGTDIILERLHERSIKTGKTVPLKAIIMMARNYDEPKLSEGFDKLLKGN